MEAERCGAVKKQKGETITVSWNYELNVAYMSNLDQETLAHGNYFSIPLEMITFSAESFNANTFSK